jgi:putative ABC transport system permease protein
MAPVVRDVQFAVRILVRNPLMTLISILTLGLGIGASTAVFSVVDATLLTPPPFQEPDRLVRLFTTKPAAGWSRMTTSLADYRDWREQSTSFEELGIYWYEPLNQSGDDHPERLLGVRATASVLTVLGTPATVGRGHDAGQDLPGAGREVLLSDSYWRRRFGANPKVVGTTLDLDGVPHEVLGVLPPEIEVAFGRFQVWLPFTYDPEVYTRSVRSFLVIGRLTPGVNVADADAEVKAIADRLAEAYPDENRGHGATVVSLTDVLLGRDTRPVLSMLVVAVGFVLLIACVNIANLLLALAGSREREFAVRAALGAGTPRLVRQLLTESALLAVVGGGLGVAIAVLGVDILAAGLEATIGPIGEIAIDRRALCFTLLLMCVTTVGFGLPVAMRASTSRFSDLVRAGTRSVLGSRGARVRQDLLVIVQVAMALALLVSAVLMIRSLIALRTVDSGFATDHLLTLSASLPEQGYASDGARAEFVESAVYEIQTVPGVQSAAAVSVIPLIGNNGNSSVTIEDRPVQDPADKIMVGSEVATPRYLETMGIPLIEGRIFTSLDRADTPGVVIINRHMAHHFWPEESAIGKRMKFGRPDSDTPWLEVIGVMGDYRQTSLDTPVRFETLRPQAQAAASAVTFVVRTHGDPATTTTDVQTAIWRVDPDLALYAVATMDEIADANTRALGNLAILLSAFGVVALVLAVGGLYGVMSYSVSRMTREIGLRMALGAEARMILLVVVRRSAMLVLLGLGAGSLLAWLLSDALRGMLFGVSALDPVTYLAVAAAMLSAGLVAGLIPASRAARIEPVVAMAGE